ncbi:MAG TPA: PP0621 family protein [Candidatus Binatia bacterium]
MLLRLLFLVLLVFLLLLLIKSYLARSRGGSRRPAPEDGEELAMDPQCQSYVPKREAIAAGGNYFCSRECAERFLADQRN